MKYVTRDDVRVISRNHLAYADAWHILIDTDYFLVSIEHDDPIGVHETVVYYANSSAKAVTHDTEHTSRALAIDWTKDMFRVSHESAIDYLLVKLNKLRVKGHVISAQRLANAWHATASPDDWNVPSIYASHFARLVADELHMLAAELKAGKITADDLDAMALALRTKFE